jgi:hypothetical protein
MYFKMDDIDPCFKNKPKTSLLWINKWEMPHGSIHQHQQMWDELGRQLGQAERLG